MIAIKDEDCVSRQAVFETIDDCNSDGLKGIFCSYDGGERFKEYIKKLPPVTPTHGTCKDCKYIYCEHHEETCDIDEYNPNFSCAYFEKRGSEE